MKSQIQRHSFIWFRQQSLARVSHRCSSLSVHTAVSSQFGQAFFSRSTASIRRSSSRIQVSGLQNRKSNFDDSSRSFPGSFTHLRAGVSYQVLAVAALSVVGILAYIGLDGSKKVIEDLEFSDALSDTMVPQLAEGRPGNLTPDQEEKLRKLWLALFQLTGVAEGSAGSSEETPVKEEAEAESGKKKSRFGLFRKNKEDSKSSADGKNGGEDDKYGETKQYHETLANNSPETIRATIWSMVKHDHPDALVLRFLRARKWDVEKALVMAVSTMNWRHNEMMVDSEIMKNGEEGAVIDSKSNDPKQKKLGEDFLAQIGMGKSFLHGTDKNGRPICVVRVRLHKQGEQCEESLEKYTVYIIETTRMVLSPPVDTATIVFDMTGFSMANMDYTPVKFMIKCFEANYPESLGAVLVHNSPWIFQGIWKVIRGWLDPVVAGKVHFTNNKADMEQFIEPNQILKELGGDEDWEYKYVEPVPGENDKMKDTATRVKLQEGREELVKQFEAATLEWIKNPEGEQGKANKEKRNKIAAELKADYWRLDPYIRARSLYDRVGVIESDGKTNWEAVRAGAEKPVQQLAHETSADDID